MLKLVLVGFLLIAINQWTLNTEGFLLSPKQSQLPLASCLVLAALWIVGEQLNTFFFLFSALCRHSFLVN